MMETPHITALSTLLRIHTGIYLGEDKAYLFETRLQPCLATHHCAGFADYIALLETAHIDDNIMQQFIQSMTTNESMFFRDIQCFNALESLLPTYAPQGDALNIWCAACASGQEAYSMAMLLDGLGITAHIDASDIDAAMIAQARRGRYNQFETQRGLPTRYLLKYFERTAPHHWQIRDELREAVQCFTHNLLQLHNPASPYDIVLCRYVLIYFDDDTKRRVLEHIACAMHPGGLLLIGNAETLMPDQPYFTPHDIISHAYVRL